MKTAVATLQSEQDELVRRDRRRPSWCCGAGRAPARRSSVCIVQPGWSTTTAGCSRSDILILGPSDRYLQYVASVLPTLGESRRSARPRSTVCIGPTSEIGAAIDWPVGPRPVRGLDVRARNRSRSASSGCQRGRCRRRSSNGFKQLDAALGGTSARASKSALAASSPGSPAKPTCVPRSTRSCPPCSAVQAYKRAAESRVDARSHSAWMTRRSSAWRAVDEPDGPLQDELNVRFNSAPPTRYSHVVVDEAQDLTEMQLRAVQRRAAGLDPGR